MRVNIENEKEMTGTPTPPNSPAQVATLDGTPDSIPQRRKSLPKRVVFSPINDFQPTMDIANFRPKFLRQDTPFKPLLEFITPRSTLASGRKSSSPNIVHRPIDSPDISPIMSEAESSSMEEFIDIFTNGKGTEKLNRYVSDRELELSAASRESTLSIYDDSHEFLNRNVSLELTIDSGKRISRGPDAVCRLLGKPTGLE